MQFARRLGLSYTFVRAMEHGLRFPSDKVLLDIAERLDLEPADLLLAAYGDRSPLLAQVLTDRGVDLPGDTGENGEVLAGAELAVGRRERVGRAHSTGRF